MPPAQEIGVEIVVPPEGASKLATEKDKEVVQERPLMGVSVQTSGEGSSEVRLKNKGVAGVDDWIVPPAKKTAKAAQTQRPSSASALGVIFLSADAIEPG